MKEATLSVEHWTTIEREPSFECRIFSIDRERNRSPRTGKAHDFWVIRSPDWVNVIPVTVDDRIVMVRQFRHGTHDLTLEVPGGIVEPEDPTPAAAARREMREESGYDSDEITSLGAIHPNPAIQDNRCWSFVARNAVRRFPIRGDGTEETEVVLVPRLEIPERIRSGEISHALVVVAFHHWGLAGGG